MAQLNASSKRSGDNAERSGITSSKEKITQTIGRCAIQPITVNCSLNLQQETLVDAFSEAMSRMLNSVEAACASNTISSSANGAQKCRSSETSETVVSTTDFQSAASCSRSVAKPQANQNQTIIEIITIDDDDDDLEIQMLSDNDNSIKNITKRINDTSQEYLSKLKEKFNMGMASLRRQVKEYYASGLYSSTMTELIKQFHDWEKTLKKDSNIQRIPQLPTLATLATEPQREQVASNQEENVPSEKTVNAVTSSSCHFEKEILRNNCDKEGNSQLSPLPAANVNKRPRRFKKRIQYCCMDSGGICSHHKKLNIGNVFTFPSTIYLNR